MIRIHHIKKQVDKTLRLHCLCIFSISFPQGKSQYFHHLGDHNKDLYFVIKDANIV